MVTEPKNVTNTQYRGSFIYEDDNLKFFSHPEGYIEPEGKSFNYIYQYKDHLGNIRLTYADSDGSGSINPNLEIIEENNYYPFGLKHKGYNNVVTSTNPAQKKKFAGEEFEEELGKNTVAFQWRDYDPAIARFNKIDRFAEQYEDLTPYHFSANSPIYYREIAGDSISLTFDKTKTQERYESVVNNGTGGFYEVQIDEDGNVTGLTATDKEGEMTEEQKAFYDEYKAVVDSEHKVEMKVRGKSVDVSVGSWALSKIDMSDIEAFDNAGEGGATSAGALIHETVEQHEKTKKGHKPGQLATADYPAAHKIATMAENRVNGNTRNGNEFTESDGSITVQRIIPNTTTGRNTVTKKKKKQN
ncbi:RHS repeat-associated core domain-containing protein [uncultured Psychroserpens sp.]|uniref:RHS repeat domain-containing protein n=1 Tax=uncultured Psychroserpens sp. TaxID=255436 RepID=UPI002639A4C3|nr:RHS repeat-associated core domain-containing protein [uncultured Psychroserpens sp.]